MLYAIIVICTPKGDVGEAGGAMRDGRAQCRADESMFQRV